jgi:penicillin-binding protein-related factor A (putative recombinase)
MDYLTLRDIAFIRVNGGKFQISGTKRWFRATDKNGVADLLVCYRGHFIAVETKSARGTQSEDQKQFHAYVERSGGRYVLARSLEDMVGAL